MIHCGKEYVDNDLSMLKNKWISETVFGLREAVQQPLCVFNNCVMAIELLLKHIRNCSRVGLHVDVDVDGIGCGVIMSDMLREFGMKNIQYVINKDKVHGIQKVHSKYFNETKSIDLMVIVDSSTNEIDTIKEFNCDVIVIDHHKADQYELSGYCNDGIHRFVIVNSTLDNNDFDSDYYKLCEINKEAFKNAVRIIGTSNMSCGVVVYELMRIIEITLNKKGLLENKRLYQWAGITLYTDSINTLNERNQWYIEKTIRGGVTENRLDTMIGSLGKYKNKITKTFIQFKLAPIINKAIRASAGSQVVDIVMNRPEDFYMLDIYKKNQEEAIKAVVKDNEVFSEEYVIKDIGSYGVSQNYNGVIASKYANMNKNAVVYTIVGDKLKGSFRGRRKLADYREEFIRNNIKAEGHETAFGFEANNYVELKNVMANLKNIELENSKTYIGIGNVGEIDCEYLYDSMETLRRNMLLMYIALGNSNVNSIDEIDITVPARMVKMKQAHEKYYVYDVDGVECRAFETLKGQQFKVYAEYTTEIQLFIKNINY